MFNYITKNYQLLVKALNCLKEIDICSEHNYFFQTHYVIGGIISVAFFLPCKISTLHGD